MRCNVTFRCALPVDLDKFPPGEELAFYIADKMTQSGLKTSVVDNYEDFAWWIESESNQRMPWALLGYIGDGVAEWLLQINSSVGLFGRLLGKSDKQGTRVFAERLQAVLSNDPSFSNVRWHLADWGRPDWSSSPA